MSSSFSVIQRSQSFSQPISFNNNCLKNSLGNENMLNRRKSLNKLGRKKTVSFSTGISIVEVEKWKKYNVDVSEVGGCMAWDAKKNEERRRKKEEEERQRKKQEDGCECIVY